MKSMRPERLPGLSAEMDALVHTLLADTYGDMQARLMVVARQHGGYMQSLLRDIANCHPKVHGALLQATPHQSPHKQSEVLYAAIEYIEAHDLYD